MSILRAASPALIALLESNQFIIQHLYTITLRDGTIYRYTDCEIDLSVGGHVFSATDLLIERGPLVSKIGIQVDNLQVDIWADAGNMMLGMPFLQLAHNGGLDGARLKMEQIFMATLGDTSAGAITRFEGRLAVDELTRFSARLTAHSDLELLNVQLPRNVFQPGCWNALYDVNCSVVKSSKAVSGTVSAGSTVRSINCSLAQAADYFTLGTIEFQTGANAGVVRTVSAYAPGMVAISLPLKAAPQAGDTFKAYPGCDGRQVTCSGKFNNLPRFRGQPYVPSPETAY